MRSRFENTWRWLTRAIAILVLALGLTACGGGDDGGDTPQTPSGLDLTISETGVWVGGTASVEASFLYRSGEAPVCAWFVDGIEGGDATVGTITQDNPAVYTAPDTAPAAGEVEISAVWEDDETVEGTAVLIVEEPQVSVTLDAVELQVLGTAQAEASLSARGREGEFQWFVNDVLGGDAASGTITQGNPATYTAPYEVPVGGGVEIEARWVRYPEDYQGLANLPVKYSIKHVDAATGMDEIGRGRLGEPYQTITFALERIYAEDDRGDTVQVAPGTYGPSIGDLFAINVSGGTVLRGENREACILEADPEGHAVFYVDGSSTVENLTITNPDPESGNYFAVGIQGDATVRHITVNDLFVQAAIRAYNNDVDGLVEDCLLHNTDEPGEGSGFIVRSGASVVLRDCTIKGWEIGILAGSDNVTPHLVERCDIKSNVFGIVLDDDGVTMDLGGGSQGSLGMNTISNNDIGLWHDSTHDIHALYNLWTEDPPLQCHTSEDTPCDYFLNDSGDLIFD